MFFYRKLVTPISVCSLLSFYLGRSWDFYTSSLVLHALGGYRKTMASRTADRGVPHASLAFYKHRERKRENKIATCICKSMHPLSIYYSTISHVQTESDIQKSSYLSSYLFLQRERER